MRTAPKATKKVLKESASASTAPQSSLKGIFNRLSEGAPVAIPVMQQGNNKATTSGVVSVTDTSPAGKAISDTINSLAQQKKIQVVTPQSTAPAQAGQPAATAPKPNTPPAPAGATGQAPIGSTQVKEKWDTKTEVSPSEKGKYAGKTKAELTKQYNTLKSSGPHKKGSKEFGKMRELSFAIRAKSGWGKVQEADRPSNSMDMGAGLGAGRNQSTFEGKKGVNPFAKKDDKAEKAGKKVTKDIEFDEKKKDGIHGKKRGPEDKKAEKAGKKVAKDIEFDADEKKDKKKKVKESMSHGIKAARLEGRSHGLKGHSHCGKNYDDMEESRAYHEGFKQGLDECYGMGVYEAAPAMPAATVGGMADGAMDEAALDEMDKTAYMKQQAIKTPGDTFKAFGQTMHDKDVLEMDSFAFEAWDKELQTLLTEGEEVREGVSVSISKGNQGSPDTVNVNATDAEADKVLQFIKTAGLGVFGGEDPSDYGSSADSDEKHGGISVVGDHDNMLSIMKRLSGVAGGSQSGSEDDSEDYADENGSEDESSMCDSCGDEQSEGHECGAEPQMVDEVETEDQMEFKVAEDNAPNDGSDNSKNATAGNAAANSALATADAPQNADDKEETVSEDDEEEDVTESHAKLDEWANDAGPGKSVSDTTFEQDIEFMTKVISGGLNKPKSTGQTTVPVVASQLKRLHTGPTTDVNESVVMDWQTLAGIK